MGLTHVPVRLEAVNGTDEVFEDDFLVDTGATDDAEPLLGVTALESAGFTVDPASQTLKRLPAIALKPVTPAHTRAGGATSPATSTRARSSAPTVAT